LKPPTFIPRAKRVLASLGAVMVGYSLYALLAVPLIEPPAEVVTPIDRPDGVQVVKPLDKRLEEQRKEFALWFKPDDWEMGSPIVLQSPNGKLVMKSYKTLPDGRVELKPCSMIFMSESADVPLEERQRRAMIMRTPQGAILEFDTPFDLSQGKIGKLVGGQLLGEVTIHSDQRIPGPEDDLFIATREVKLTETEITTPERVDFRFGPNYGHGRDLIILLRPKTAPKPDISIGPNFGGMTSLELLRDVNMHLQSAAGDFFPGSKRPNAKESVAVQTSAKNATPAKPQPPVEVKCDGKFRFDAEKYVATFNRNVDVLRVNPSGPSDQLTCEMLSLFFEAVPTAPGDAATIAKKSAPTSSKTSQGSSKLEATRIEARGNPVVVRAPSNGVQARGQELDYNMKTGVGNLRDGKEVFFLQGRNEIHSRELFFQPSQTSRLGQFKANGPGWYKGLLPSESRDGAAVPPSQQSQPGEQPIEARWTRHLHFRPHEQNQLLSIEGSAHVQSAATGTIDADQIHLWLLESSPGAQPVNRSKAGGPAGLQPDRLLALGHVRIDSPQLTGRVERLEAWFEQAGPAVAVQTKQDDPRSGLPVVERTPPPHLSGPILSPPRGPQLPIPRPRGPQHPAIAPRGPETAPQPPPAVVQAAAQIPAANATQQPRPPGVPFGLPGMGAAPGNAPEAPRSRYHVDGELLRAQITRRGELSELSEVVVQRKVRFMETKTENPGELPLKLTGDQLHLVQPKPNAALVTITGDLAHVEARGMTMDGGTIHLDQGKNRLWIDGRGVMTLPVNRNMEGQPSTPGGKLEVTWQGRMDFNGTLAAFERGVVARHERDLMRTELLEVTLDRQVNFGVSTASERPNVHHLSCRGGSYLESHKFDERGKPLSVDKLQTKDLDVDQQSGNIKGQGPGWLSSIRWNDGQTLTPAGPTQPGQLPQGQLPPNAPQGMRPQSGQALAAAPPKKEQLVFLAVEFQQRMSGNLHHKNMLFEQQVRTVYGNVKAWDDTLDPNAPEELKPGDVLMTSQQLAVSEVLGPTSSTGATRNMELAATGNARVDGKTEAGMNFYSQSARLTYSQIKDLLVLEGDGRTDARLFRQMRVGGPMSEAAAGSIMYWRSTNRAQVGDARFLDLSELPGGEKKR
jgi:lipopolysaccharide export system protein LptA